MALLVEEFICVIQTSWEARTLCDPLRPLPSDAPSLSHRNQQGSPPVGIMQGVKSCVSHGEAELAARIVWWEEKERWMSQKDADSYLSLEKSHVLSIPGYFWSHDSHYLDNLDNLRGFLYDKTWLGSDSFSRLYPEILISLIIIPCIIRYYCSLIIRHYAKCFLCASSFTLLSAWWVRHHP